MVDEPKRLFARPVFRWLAGFSCLVCLAIGVAYLFPGSLTGEPGYPLAAVFLCGAFIFGRIAAAGRLGGTPRNQ